MTKPHILVLEDYSPRAEQIRTLLPHAVQCVCVRTPEGAIDILKRDKFEGVLLGYSFGGSRLTGADIAKVIAETQSRFCEVYVHSDSRCGADRIISVLRPAGFHVEQHPWSETDMDCVKRWADELALESIAYGLP